MSSCSGLDDFKQLMSGLTANSFVSSSVSDVAATAAQTLQQQRVETTKQGKKRIVPQFVKPIDVAEPLQQFAQKENIKIVASIAPDFDGIRLRAQSATTSQDQSVNQAALGFSQVATLSSPSRNGFSHLSQSQRISAVTPANSRSQAQVQHYFPVLPIHIAEPLSNISAVDGVLCRWAVRQANFTLRVAKANPNRLLCKCEDKPYWSESFSQDIIGVFCNDADLIVILTGRNIMHVLSISGSRMTPPLVLECPVWKLSVKRSSLLLLLCNGSMFRWSLDSYKCLHTCNLSNLIISSLPDRLLSIVFPEEIFPNADQQPFPFAIKMASGTVLAYNVQSKSWMIPDDMNGHGHSIFAVASSQSLLDYQDTTLPMQGIEVKPEQDDIHLIDSFLSTHVISQVESDTQAHLEEMLSVARITSNREAIKKYAAAYVACLARQSLVHGEPAVFVDKFIECITMLQALRFFEDTDGQVFLRRILALCSSSSSLMEAFDEVCSVGLLGPSVNTFNNVM